MYPNDIRETNEETYPRRSTMAIPVAIAIAGLFIGGAIFLSNGEHRQQAAVGGTGDKNTQKVVPAVTDTDHILGNPKAPIVIVEYSDPECPFCKNFHQTMHRVIAEYGPSGNVAWVYRQFPLETLHSKAPQEAAATECASELGGNDAFWSYLDKLFEKTPSNNGLELSILPQIATEIGLPRSAFEACLSSGKYIGPMKQAFNDALAAGANGTPSSFVLFKGQQIEIPGAQPFASVAGLIDDLLKQAGLTNTKQEKKAGS